MRIKLSKKSQVYGLSSFIYALAIALILLVGLIGMSKEFETKSHAADYEAQALIISRTAENVKKLLSEERSYVLDKSLYLTGAYGGSLSFKDQQNYGTGCDSMDNTIFSYLPEKQIPYWYDSVNHHGQNCIPTDDSVIDTLNYWTQGPFSKPDSVITDVLKELSGGRIFNYIYVVKILNYTSSSFEASWFPSGTVTEYWADPASTTGYTTKVSKLTDVTLLYPPRNPVIEYSFEPFVHSVSNTPFFQIKHEAAKFVQDNKIRSLLNDSDNNNFPIPYFLDESFISAKRDTSYSSEQNCITDTYPSSNCTKPQIYKRPFKALVSFIYENYPNYSQDWQRYSCSSVDLTKISNTYSSTCKIFTKYNIAVNKLEVDSTRGVNGFEGMCNSTTLDINNNKAMRCVLISEIHEITKESLSLNPRSDFNWKITFNTFNLTYNGASSTEFEYKTVGHD